MANAEAAKREVFARAVAAAEDEHKAAIARKAILARRKELLEEMATRKEREESAARAERARAAAEAEQKRIAEETKKREQDRINKELEAVRIEEAKKMAKSLQERGGLKLSEEELANMDTNKLVQMQVEQIEKEKKELAERLRLIHRKMDHLERANRREEAPLLSADYERQKEEDLKYHKAARITLLQTSKEKHAADLEIRSASPAFCLTTSNFVPSSRTSAGASLRRGGGRRPSRLSSRRRSVVNRFARTGGASDRRPKRLSVVVFRKRRSNVFAPRKKSVWLNSAVSKSLNAPSSRPRSVPKSRRGWPSCKLPQTGSVNVRRKLRLTASLVLELVLHQLLPVLPLSVLLLLVDGVHVPLPLLLVVLLRLLPLLPPPLLPARSRNVLPFLALPVLAVEEDGVSVRQLGRLLVVMLPLPLLLLLLLLLLPPLPPLVVLTALVRFVVPLPVPVVDGESVRLPRRPLVALLLLLPPLLRLRPQQLTTMASLKSRRASTVPLVAVLKPHPLSLHSRYDPMSS